MTVLLHATIQRLGRCRESPTSDDPFPSGPRALPSSCIAAHQRNFASPLNPPRAMTIQNDAWITEMAEKHGMIEPFENLQVRSGVISYGVSAYGYDMRVAREF